MITLRIQTAHFSQTGTLRFGLDAFGDRLQTELIGEVNDHLGDAYWRAGRTLEARFQWNIAAAVDTDGAVKERVAKKLAGGLDAVGVTPDPGPVAEGQAAPTP